MQDDTAARERSPTEHGEYCVTLNVLGGAAGSLAELSGSTVQASTFSRKQKSLPFIYKLLEILRENSIRQLGRWLQRKGEGFSASLCVNGSKKTPKNTQSVAPPVFDELQKSCDLQPSSSSSLSFATRELLPAVSQHIAGLAANCCPSTACGWGDPRLNHSQNSADQNCSVTVLDPTSQIPALATPTADKANPEMITGDQLPSPWKEKPLFPLAGGMDPTLQVW